MLADSSVDQRFGTRVGLLLSALGIAVGTGNIWRFPRIAAQSGGDEGAGALILAWIIFLLLWSVPLIIAEYMIGRKYRFGVIGSFVKGMGKRFAWMGAFVAFVATAIGFFYAVIVGWALYYFFQMLFFPLPVTNVESMAIWDGFQSSWWPFVMHFLAIAAGGLAIWKGVRSIEKVNKVLIPFLILIILAAVIRAISLPGSGQGIAYLFRIEWAQLKTPDVWLQALTQNAWDTGAGWGLFLSYAAYMHARHGTVKNAFITGFGNNIISLLMATMIFGTVFSVMQFGYGYADAEVLEVMKTSGPASTGLTFIWMPQLFERMSGGGILAVFFFLGLACAGFSSLMSMLELSTRALVDRGIKRNKAVLLIIAFVYLLGVPSAMSLNILSNQDFVWGLGLMVSGVFIASFCIKYGISRLKNETEFAPGDWKPGLWWEIPIRFFVPAAGVILLVWWMYLSVTQFAPEEWFNPLNPFSLMSVLLQWLAITGLFIVFNKQISKLYN
ncbi:MAG: sodium-dependent transporter [Bacteroidia bacterium]|nr:MAG: sodium-dependent transporter [Bacteroidia bacterium]